MSGIAELRVTYDQAINYAFQQNAIPVVKELWLRNGDAPRQGISIRLTTEPAFAESLELHIQSLGPGEESRHVSIDMKLAHDFLAELPESVSGWLHIEVAEGEQVLHKASEPIRLLTRNEWCGLTSLPEILAAFVLPNDPMVMTILGRAAELLRENTGRAAFNGYHDKNRRRAWEQAAAIYRAIDELSLRYIVPPASFETTGQKVRFPSDVAAQRFATCLDAALLFAACCEQAGLYPLVLIHEGHAYAAVWLEEQSLAEPVLDDRQHIRKLSDLGLMSVFEAVAVTNDQASTLDHAELLARDHLVTEKRFYIALDVHRARMARIRPLPIPGQAAAPASDPQPSSDISIGLGTRNIPEAVVAGAAPPKAATRVDQWKSRLLDLSLRNRLLNFRETKTTIRILSASPESVEDELAASRELALMPRPRLLSEQDPRDAATMTRQEGTNALLDHLRRELELKRLHTALEPQEHARRLTELFRAARTALEENGTNTLFAAVGMLEWRETEHGDRVLRAPLLLVPVELKRKSVLEGFSLRRIDEETRLNVTLIEMLRQHFHKEIAGLDPLPEDDHGVDVDRVFQLIRAAVREMPGWEVKTEVWLGQFSFTKFLLWQDLTDRLDVLVQNRVVRHLIEEASTQYPNPPDDVRPAELDNRFHPSEVFCPRSADSSQLAAVMAAAAGHDFVLEGPPGTGKSQTITNIIAHCLGQGKRVLFVAEKRAALDVVHRRLREDGLEPFCLELHSNKTGKAEVLAQFDRALKFVADGEANDWKRRANELAKLRDALNDYTAALHERYPCGLSPWHCIDHLAPRTDEPTVRLPTWQPVINTSSERLAQAREAARLLRDRALVVAPLANHPLAPIRFEHWTPRWAEDAAESIADVRAASIEARDAMRAALDALQWTRPDVSIGDINRLLELAESLVAAPPVGEEFLTTPWSKLSEEIDRCAKLAGDRAKLRADLSKVQAACADPSRHVPAEEWSVDEAGHVAEQCRAWQEIITTAQTAVRDARTMLGASHGAARRSELEPLRAFAATLMAAPALGPEFAASDWPQWQADFDRWASLVRERRELRPRIEGFDELALLTLDLYALRDAWRMRSSSWFLPRMLKTRMVRRALSNVRPDHLSPAVGMIDGILEAAVRLRTIAKELAEARPRAESLLGPCWRMGEPVTEELEQLRAWIEQFDARLRAVCPPQSAWMPHLREALASPLSIGPSALSASGDAGSKLARLRDNLDQLGTIADRAINEAALDSEKLHGANDFCGGLGAALKVVARCAPRVAKANEEMEALSGRGRAIAGDLWRGGEPRLEELEHAKAWGEKLNARMATAAASDLAWMERLRRHLSNLFAAGQAAIGTSSSFRNALEQFGAKQAALEATLATMIECAAFDRARVDSAGHFIDALLSCVDRMIAAWPKVREWSSWRSARHAALELGLDPLVETLESPSAVQGDVAELFERSFRKALLFEAIESRQVLRNFFGSEHGKRIQKFRDVDEKMQSLARQLIAARLAAEVPREQSRDDVPKQEMVLLRKELGKKMRHIPVRKLIGGIPTLLHRLKPCVLMSPLSVAQYLDAAHQPFDVVVFDEASQIPVWDAIGAIARGTQLIVVGDPKQLPPTNFFATVEDDEDDVTPPEFKDLESILDELLTNGLRHKRLQWHYRSRHEGLIAFSNRQYYENELLTFPSPESAGGGVQFRHLPTARYDKGKSRTNRVEAEALVRELVARLCDPTAPTRSYGVVTFSQAQQSLVENLLDEERAKHPELEAHFGDDPPVEGEPVFVKNLENVQGDERDVILFSICYGPDAHGKVAMNFGPLNREGGERRLNVAVTRAKHEVIVFSGLRADQIDLTRTRARGVRDLKLFLDYAERGHRALAVATPARPDAEAESEFERLVAARLRDAGYEVHHQVGCSDYRIDLGVIDPAAPGRYLLGVECDGATYHRAATARDRDKLRQAILEGLGWQLHRIWSTDWWHDPQAEFTRLADRLRDLETSRAS